MDVTELEGNDLEKACELTSDLSFAEGLAQSIQKDTLTLIALHYMMKGVSIEQIMADLNEEGWHFKHEILTRWCWSSAQKKATQKGRSFNRIYLCEVGPRERRQNIDREFFTYLKFMPYYQEHSKKGYLLSRYNGDTQISPDFIAVNEEGYQIGIEVTEATESERASFETKQEDRLMNELVEEFKDIPCHFTIWSRPDWSFLLDNANELKSWLRRICEGKESLIRHHRKDKYYNPKLDLMVSYKPEKLSSLFTDISGNGTGDGYEGNEIEYRIENAVTKRISKKLTSPPPSVKPCLLVIYDNAQLTAADYKRLFEIAINEAGTGFQTHFKEVWLLDDQQCLQLR
jgi:hypothetical protein